MAEKYTLDEWLRITLHILITICSGIVYIILLYAFINVLEITEGIGIFIVFLMILGATTLLYIVVHTSEIILLPKSKYRKELHLKIKKLKKSMTDFNEQRVRFDIRLLRANFKVEELMRLKKEKENGLTE